MDLEYYDERKKYNAMERCLQAINRKYVSLSKTKKKRNNVILRKVLKPLLEEMKKQDKLFNQLYKEVFFGGSYYDGLKVGSPNEYDIDLLLQFPPTHEIEIYTDADTPGYVNLELLRKKGYGKFCDDLEDEWASFLDTTKVLSWMEGVVQKALNAVNKFGRWTVFGEVKVSKSGPAFTLILKNAMGKQKDICLDLVPCFLFNGDKWPEDGFDIYEEDESSYLSQFFVVPKHPKCIQSFQSKYWRLSFQIQERDLIHDLHQLKPALKLVKKLRDVQQHKQISSYFLKTIVLWEVGQQPEYFWSKNSLSYVFMHILKMYHKYLTNEEILYYWNENFNLLEGIQADLANMSNRLGLIINKIEANISDSPDIINEYILTPSEQNGLYAEYLVY